MSPRNSTSPTFYRKPRPDIYTVLLAIALAFVLIGLIFAWLETNDYGGQYFQGGPSARAAEAPATGSIVVTRGSGPRSAFTV